MNFFKSILQDLKEDYQLGKIDRKTSYIKKIENPTYTMMQRAVMNDANAIKWIKNPPKEIQLMAVFWTTENLKYIENLDPDVLIGCINGLPLMDDHKVEAYNNIKALFRDMDELLAYPDDRLIPLLLRKNAFTKEELHYISKNGAKEQRVLLMEFRLGGN